MAAMPNGTGYWLAWSTGAVGAYGDAARYGSMYDLRLDDPVVGIVSTPDATGYWLVAATAAGEGYRLVTSWP
jgi:hypothetical protein